MTDILLLCLAWGFLQVVLIRSMRPVRIDRRLGAAPDVSGLQPVRSSNG